MTAPPDTPTGRAIVKTARAALRLVSSSSELLTVSQLFAVKSDLHTTLAIVNGQIQATQSDDQKLVIDLSDWEDTSDEDGKDSGKAPGAAEQEEDPLAVPDPYPLSPPAEMDELPEYWYVVDRGTEVGIFADETLSTYAVAGVSCGHQTKVKSWYVAAKLYNSLWDEGLIDRVRA